MIWSYLIKEVENFRMHFTFGLLLSRKIILISHCSGVQQDFNPVFNDRISCAYIGCNSLVIEYSLCGGTISPRFTPESFLATLTSDSWLLLTQRNKYIFLSIRLFGWSEILINLGSMFFGFRNSESCSVGHKKFRVLSCILWGIRIT